MAVSSFPNIGNVIVAVIDNGIYKSHEDLPVYDKSDDAHAGKSPSELYGDHGTAVAGVIGATANNKKGVAGVASGVKIRMRFGQAKINFACRSPFTTFAE